MHTGESIHIAYALAGWVSYIFDQYFRARRKHPDIFNWGLFVARNLPAAYWNMVAIVVTAGLAVSTTLELGVFESFALGFGGGHVIKGRLNTKSKNNG